MKTKTNSTRHYYHSYNTVPYRRRTEPNKVRSNIRNRHSSTGSGCYQYRKENDHKKKKKPKKTTTTNMDMDTCMNKNKQVEDTRFISNNNNIYSLGIKVSLFSYCSSIIGG